MIFQQTPNTDKVQSVVDHYTKTPTVLLTIKGDAMNRKRARVWIERDLQELIPFGFTHDMRCDLKHTDNGLLITFNRDGKKKPTVRKGSKTKVIFDCCMTVAERHAMFKGAQRLTVWISDNQLLVTI